MDRPLAVSERLTLSLPLCSKPLAFSRFANRTRALSAIMPIIRMSFRAMNLSGVQCSDVVGFAESIVANRSESQMFDVHAITSLTRVVNNTPSRYRAVGVEVRNPMSLSITKAKHKGAVPVSVLVSRPDDALAPWLSFGLETGQLFGGQ